MIELKVVHNQAIEYDYKIDGTQVSSQKVQVVLQSKIPHQYCLGVAKLQKKDKAELRKIEDRWQTGTTWKFRAIKLLNEKPAFVHTSYRTGIDLRKSQAEAMLQRTDFPTSTSANSHHRRHTPTEANATFRSDGHSSQNH